MLLRLCMQPFVQVKLKHVFQSGAKYVCIIPEQTEIFAKFVGFPLTMLLLLYCHLLRLTTVKIFSRK